MREWYQSTSKIQNIITQRKNIVLKINADKLEEGDRGKQTNIRLIFLFWLTDGKKRVTMIVEIEEWKRE